jgi:hypothetical protein
MDACERFHQLLKHDFSPLLRADGFKGSGITFRRIQGDRIDVINVQGSRSGGQCCVNFATHFLFLPSEGGGQVTDPKKFRECDCTFRDRLHEETESDHWWTYGPNDAEAEASLANLLDLYKRRGALFFRKFEPFPDVFERITAVEMDAGDFSKMPAAMTGVYAALTMARIMRHLGRHQKGREFAEVGLRRLGHAVGLKAELERLRDAG